ncbi:MAG TPA: DUF1800 domain-containing protein [Burkholderiaceae bacterium]|nr:DUF1800 domain-containing protein [Burkholderiaceae bacterium]
MNEKMPWKYRSLLATAVAAAVLAGCGGGGGDSPSAGSPAGSSSPSGTSAPSAPSGPTSAPITPPSDTEAVRFLTQATMGATSADVAKLKQQGFDAWLEEQFALPRSSHLDFVISEIGLDGAGGTQITMDPMYRSWWKQSLTGNDQLRQRVTFALSQIVVTSAADAQLINKPAAMASYLDVLAKHAFGNYRDLLEEVSLHPTMGRYLTALGNRADGGRVPDENYAREIMQLFSIGIVQLNNDGTPKLVNGQPVDTYTMDDIRGLAKVFTGWSWGNEGTPDLQDNRFFGNEADRKREIIPMQHYPKFHSPESKAFLGTTIAAGTPGPQALKTALDTIFNHPNVGPFLAQRLIQRLVTSNPSPAYVDRVAAVFNNNGKGVRGDLKAVVRAVLFDPEARDANAMASAQFGKLREPVLRVTAWARAFGAESASGIYRIGILDEQLFQTPMRAPTVFNFYRPGFVPPNTDIAAKGMVAPEFQITHEVSVANYTNFMQQAVGNGVGFNTMGRPDVRSDYKDLVALAEDPEKLVARINLMLTGNQIGQTSLAAISSAVATVKIPAPVSGTTGQTITYNGKQYSSCANEGQRCAFTGTYDVIYGANGTFATKAGQVNGVDCTNEVFGDPVVGVAKACFYGPIAAATTPSNVPPANQKEIDDAKLNRVRLAVFMSTLDPGFLVTK